MSLLLFPTDLMSLPEWRDFCDFIWLCSSSYITVRLPSAILLYSRPHYSSVTQKICSKCSYNRRLVRAVAVGAKKV